MRELISNAGRCLWKPRFLRERAGTGAETSPSISISTDEAAGTRRSRTRAGMTRDELVQNSGSRTGHEGLPEGAGGATEAGCPADRPVRRRVLPAFIAAKLVTVSTRSHQDGAEGWKWSSEGGGGFTLGAGRRIFRAAPGSSCRSRTMRRSSRKPDHLEQIIKRYLELRRLPLDLERRVNTAGHLGATKSEVGEEDTRSSTNTSRTTPRRRATGSISMPMLPSPFRRCSSFRPAARSFQAWFARN